jgi:Fe-S-cluster containining protein
MSVIVGSFRLATELFIRTKLRNRCVEHCPGDCCSEGVSITLREVERIKAHADELQPYLVEPFDFSTWETAHQADIGTPVLNENKPNEQCWFLRENRLCAIHTFTIDKQLPVASLKPYFCLFFPLTLIDLDINVTEIGVDGKAYETCLRDSEHEGYLFRQFERELRRVIGEANYYELEQRYPEV